MLDRVQFSPWRLAVPLALVAPKLSLRLLARAIDRTTTRLSSIRPPADVAEEHVTLTHALRELGQGMRAIAADSQLSRLELIEKWTALPAVEDAKRAGNAMRAKGYEIP